MASLMTQECGTVCKEAAEFSMTFVILSLKLLDDGRAKGFEDILITITFDGNVIKIENLAENEDGALKQLGHQLTLQSTPENLAKKLRSSPIMFDLSRGCSELGTYKLEISDCFIDALKCEEFSSETCTVDVTFIRDGMENAEMTLAYRVSRSNDAASMAKLFKGLQSKKNKKLADSRSTDVANFSDCFDDLSELEITSDTDLCPLQDEESTNCQTTSVPISSSKSKSSPSKCFSDIAASLNAFDFSDDRGTFGNGGFSISGVTCENKGSFVETAQPNPSSKCNPEVKIRCKTRSQSIVNSNNCKVARRRVCLECFDDLSALPKEVPCPTCLDRAQQHRRLVSFKSDQNKTDESQGIRNCIKSIFEEIFVETKDRLISDRKRLKRPTKKKKQRHSADPNETKKPTGNHAMPRCNKVQTSRTHSRFAKSTGLRVKHPGVVIGHHCCRGNDSLVPKNMGWMWNVGVSERGWRPGAVRKSVAIIMKLFLTPPVQPIEKGKPNSPPTLRVRKKNGEFTIVMNPLRDEKKFEQEASPIVFKLEKSGEARKRSMARIALKDRGIYSRCDCTTLSNCKCLSECEKARIRFELMNVSKDFCINPAISLCDLNDSSESEIDFEFTPSFDANSRKKSLKCKPPRVSVAATQYETQVIEDIDDSLKCGKTIKKPQAKEASNDKPQAENVRKSIKQIVKVMRDPPVKPCCPTNYSCDVSYNHRFTTNYNPMYAQCPPQPPICFSQHHQYTCC